VRLLVAETRPHILCLQETKLPVVHDSVCASLWGISNHAYSFRPSVGASGGLLTMWDCSDVEVWSTVSQEHAIIIHGRFIKTNEEFHLVNVYAPCEVRAKQELWASLSLRLQQWQGRNVCVYGDFNAVHGVEERRSVRNGDVYPDFGPFNNFIEENVLIDLPLRGRRFTWFKGDGLSMSKIDRFLLSEDWCLRWPNYM